MVDLYEAIIGELEARKVAYARKYPPYYVSSLGCHMFNLMNQEKGNPRTERRRGSQEKRGKKEMKIVCV